LLIAPWVNLELGFHWQQAEEPRQESARRLRLLAEFNSRHDLRSGRHACIVGTQIQQNSQHAGPCIVFMAIYQARGSAQEAVGETPV